MELLYKSSADEGVTTLCYAVNDYISAWITHSPIENSLTLGHHTTRFGSGLEDAQRDGILFTTDLYKFLKISGAEFEAMARDSIDFLKSSNIVSFGNDKSLQVLYHDIYKRKVQICDGKKYIRMPYPIFIRMIKTLHELFGISLK